MTKSSYEYLIVNTSNWINEVKVEDQFNGHWEEEKLDEEFGADGWELCAIRGIYFYFKRKLD